jgi:sugar/nucleoside kinase (ribokinase family)
VSAPATGRGRPVRLTVVGDLMVDVRITGRAHAAAIELRPGGSALNSGLWAAALGAETTVVGRVGADLAGGALVTFLAEAGLRTEITVDRSLPTGTFAVVDGDLRVDRGANAAVWRPESPGTPDVVLLSGYLPPATIAAARGTLDAPCVALGLGRLERLPIDADVVIGDVEEAERLTGERDPVAAARQLAAGGRLACVTLGPDGALAARGAELLRARPRARHAGAAEGAGDAFASGLLVALASGVPLADALVAGCEAGARAAASGGVP